MTTDGPREMMGGRELVVCTVMDMASFAAGISVILLMSSIIYQGEANWEFVLSKLSSSVRISHFSSETYSVD